MRERDLRLDEFSGRTVDQHKRAVAELIQLCEQRIGLIRPQALAEPKALFEHNCLLYLARQVRRLLAWFAESDIDLVALVARSIFELHLTVKYYLNIPDGIALFLRQAEVQNVMIHTATLHWIRATHPDENDPVRKQFEHIRTYLDDGRKLPRIPTMRDLAKGADMEQEYDGFYRRYSQYVHPTSWIINKETSEVERSPYREMFIMQALNSAVELGKLLGAVSLATPL